MKIINKKIIILGVLLSPFLFFNHITSALSYESSQGISFTLNPTITLSVSGDLSINNLSPGDYKDSNIITVTAESNAVSGYSLSSTVGNSTHTSPSFSNTNLNHTNGTNTFTNLSTNKASLAAFDENNNTWGYSWCDGTCNAGTDPSLWVSGSLGSTSTGYNGLPIYTTDSPIQLVNSSTSGASTISFKIGARSTTSQIAGEYTNIINFIGVAKPNPPIVYMQNATLADCGKDMVDIRDNTVYTTALVGDRCWMTKNLDLAGGTRLSSSDTDFDASYTLPTTNGWIVVNDKLVMPASSTSGFDTNNYAYVYNSNSTVCSNNSPCYSYYSWDTATVGSGRSINTDNTDAPYSICPKGWHLPNTRTGTNSSSDFRALTIALGGSSTIRTYDSTTTPTGAEIFNKLSNAPLYFLLAGRYVVGSFSDSSSKGYYWSATSCNDTDNAQYLLLNTNLVSSATYYYRADGFSVRCVLNS